MPVSVTTVGGVKGGSHIETAAGLQGEGEGEGEGGVIFDADDDAGDVFLFSSLPSSPSPPVSSPRNSAASVRRSICKATAVGLHTSTSTAAIPESPAAQSSGAASAGVEEESCWSLFLALLLLPPPFSSSLLPPSSAE